MGASDETDPHGIAPDGFVDRYPSADTVPEALRIAERVASTTSESERERCPYCGSIQVKVKSLKYESKQRKDGKFRCARHGCREHFDKTADETTIFMTDERTDAFDWIDSDELTDTAERGFTAVLRGVDDERLTEIVFRLYQPYTDTGPSYRDLTEIIPYSRKWIGDRVRAWKDGEHRELVADPTDEPEPITVDDSSASAAVATDGGRRRRRWGAYGT